MGRKRIIWSGDGSFLLGEALGTDENGVELIKSYNSKGGGRNVMRGHADGRANLSRTGRRRCEQRNGNGNGGGRQLSSSGVRH